MEKKDINLQIENSENSKPNKFSVFSSTTPFFHIDAKRRKSSINYSKLKFNQNILIDILKKANLKKNQNNQNTQSHTYLNLNNNSKNKNLLFKNYKISYNLNKKFQDLPVLSNFHNITDEKINDLIKSDINNNEYKSNKKKPQKITNLKTNFNYKNDKILKSKRNNNYFYNKKFYNNFDRRYSNKNNSYNKNTKDLKRPISKQRSIKIKLNDLYLNFANNKLFKSKKIEPIIHTISSNLKKININQLDKLNSNLETKKWLESIKNSIDKFDLFNRGSKIDRLLFYMIKPEECFEENVFDVKPGDKYQLFKNQIAKHKSKLDNILVDIKLNQIKNEYLMKKYIFDLLSRRKKIY